MRKQVFNRAEALPQQSSRWFDLEAIAKVEVTSEDPDYPVESVFSEGPGWRAGQRGRQAIRLVFDEPQRVTRIRVRFVETEAERTQEFTIRCARDSNSPRRELVRQQWNFNRHDATTELEEYRVDLDENISVLELRIDPD